MPLKAAIPKYRTTVDKEVWFDRDKYRVWLHGTLIVQADMPRSGEGIAVITLHSGGWRTRTTKRRMNQVLDALGISAVVYQNNFIWYVRIHETMIQFYDNMTVRIYGDKDGLRYDARNRSGERLGHGVSSNTQRGNVQPNPKLPSYSAYRGAVI